MTNPSEYQPASTPTAPAPPAHELDILYSAIAKLADAQTCDEVLNAVADYPRSNGATAGILSYIHSDSSNVPEAWEAVAGWGDTSGYQHIKPGTRNPIAQILPAKMMTAIPREPLLIPDATVSDLVQPTTRERCRQAQIYGVAFLPLHFRDHWTGFIAFSWNKPYHFRKQDQRLYRAFALQVSIVAQNAYAERQIQAAEESMKDQAGFLQELIDYIPNPVFYKDVQGLYRASTRPSPPTMGNPVRKSSVNRSTT